MRITPIQKNFIYPTITERHYRLGSVVSPILRENGDWRDFLPPEERQNIRGIESSACYIEAQQHAIATILEEQFGMNDNNFSARFNALKSNGTDYGGDPLEGAESIRKDGLIPDALMPFGDDIQSWSDFHSWKGVNESLCEKTGKDFLDDWILNYEIVFERGESKEVKYRRLKEALKYSPIPMSVYGWVDENGVYIKPESENDNHLTLCVYVDEQNRPYFFDTYSPFIKISEPFYNSDFALKWSVKENEMVVKGDCFIKKWLSKTF